VTDINKEFLFYRPELASLYSLLEIQVLNRALYFKVTGILFPFLKNCV
jgi:hypothetical protein